MLAFSCGHGWPWATWAMCRRLLPAIPGLGLQVQYGVGAWLGEQQVPDAHQLRDAPLTDRADPDMRVGSG